MDAETLNSSLEGAIYIPFDDSSQEEEEANDALWCSIPSRDLHEGPVLRLAEYDKAWTKCYARVQDIIHEFQVTLASELIDFVVNSHLADEEAMPPFQEIPAAAVIGDPTSRALIFDVVQARFDMSNDHDNAAPVLSCQLTNKSCTNLTTAVRSLVSGFIDKTSDDGTQMNLDPPKRHKGATNLLPYDLELLCAWYADVKEQHEQSPNLLVFFQDLESMDSTIIQDLIYICSLHISRIPLIFIFGLSVSADYLHASLPFSVLSVLDIEHFQIPGGMPLFESLISRVFLDPTYHPGLMLSPAVFELLLGSYTSQTASLNSFLSTLQLCYMYHFSLPLSVFADNNLLGTRNARSAIKLLSRPDSEAFSKHLCAETWPHIQDKQDLPPSMSWSAQVSQAHALVKQSKSVFFDHCHKFRIGFRVFLEMRTFLKENGYNVHDLSRKFPTLVALGLRGGLHVREVQNQLEFARKLTLAQSQILLIRIYEFLSTPDVGIVEEEILASIEGWMDNLTEITETTGSGIPSGASTPAQDGSTHQRGSQRSVSGTPNPAESASNFQLVQLKELIWNTFDTWFASHLKSFDELPLSPIWLLRASKATATLLNPSLHFTIVSALIRPQPILDCACCTDPQNSLADLPDTSVLFHRYLNSGKMINLYDWYESFAMGLEGESRGGSVNLGSRPHHSDAESDHDAGNDPLRTPRKPKKVIPRTPKKKIRSGSDRDRDGSGSEGEDEYGPEWKREVQARFLRSIHEMNLLGFLKQTGRKKDHVLRTVFDLLE
ncbi:hypothetical protein BOTBODRAFT_61955 [Botryobasidium botryosum FD-172 SS1]|uniref:Uncharacterized protein n=1 Tax=Botryobasidium botryosum (strain FD-172 SS1) TaxID=930990 RepID=A0A067NAV5_BOTB1|nr:hypothetical protein BOTBODRAFT_61955 [Botryobasidium botryosum FD-172 SS1]